MAKKQRSPMIERAILFSEKIENLFGVRVIRDGLVTMIPILMIGAFALVLQSFPVEAYQEFINSFAHGFLYDVFHMIYQATFGVLSFYMALSFSISFFSLKSPDKPINMWGVGSVLASYMIMIGVWSKDFSVSDLGATSAFLAILTSIISSHIFYAVSQKVSNYGIYIHGADSRLGSTIDALLPSAVTVIIAALISFLVTLSGQPTVHDLITSFFVSAFALINNLFVKGLLFIFASSFLWLFGIHGSDILQGVSDSVFAPLIDANLLAKAAHTAPKEILCKPFFDCFILMGGCGSSICLFLAIILFSKNKGMRTIAKTAGFPLLFNINELLVFGLPIVFNPVMVIPFLLVPVTQYLVSYFAIAVGLVPKIVSVVEWTTPVFISGYSATGSVAGSILQLVNILIGVAIYVPFVKLMGSVKDVREEQNRESFVKWFKQVEGSLPPAGLTGLSGIYGDVAKRMALELKDAVKEEKFKLYYQPQYDYDGNCIGVEALLRWPVLNWLSVYPPILIQLAREQGILLDMEKRILKRAISQREQVYKRFGRGIKISVNVTGSTLAEKSYWEFLKAQWAENPFDEGFLCIEVTEQDAVVFSEEIISKFKECKELGIKFAIDDFSAGQTSIEYLKNGIFDLLKIDGSLVVGVTDNTRCRNIISSLVALSNSLSIDCVAEYVESEDIRQTLHTIGCNQYQGFLYSAAVPLED